MAKVPIDDTYDIITIIQNKMSVIDPQGTIIPYSRFLTFKLGDILDMMASGKWKYERQLSNTIKEEQ